MEIQQSVKNNAEDLQTFIREMTLWEKEMKRKEKLLFESPESELNQNLPPIRNKISKMENSKLGEHNLVDQKKREQSLFEKERGNEFVKQKKWMEAVQHYTEAIDTYAWDATFYANRAQCFLKLKKWKEAETDCTTALQIDPNYDKAHFRRALALKELNQFKEARDDLLEVLRLNSDNSRAHNELANLEKLIQTHKISEMPSISVKAELPKDKKQLAYTKKEKGNALVKLKDWKSAIECYTEACNLYPEDASFYLNRALCFLKTNEAHKTILDCCRALELDSNNVKAFYRRALAHQKLNNLPKAHEDLLTAFKLDPTNKDIEKMLNTIETRLGVFSDKFKKDEENRLQLEGNDKIANLNPNNVKRITGERFTKLGGYFVKPEKKAPHLFSKKPLRKINVIHKDEDADTILESAFKELYTVGSLSESHHNSNDLINTELPNSCKSEMNVMMHDFAKLNSDIIDELPVPKTAIQFMASWDKLNSKSNLQFMFLKKIGGSNFPNLFKDALESYIFSEILEVLAEHCIECNELVYEFLDGFSRVKRFSALLLFATEDDNKNIELLLKRCERINEVPKDKMNELASRYYC